MRERKLEAYDLLKEKGLPSDLVDFVVDIDLNKVKEKIEVLEKTYNKSIETGINSKLSGKVPEDFSKDTQSKEKKHFNGAF
ncbi:MAG: DUF4355 domain-containing protein [Erysipelotrichaceae bacterium]